MKKKSDVTTVYWTSPKYMPSEGESWSFLYSEPKKVINQLRSFKSDDKNKNSSTIFACPAFKDSLKNVYAFYCQLDDQVVLPKNFNKDNLDKVQSKVPILVPRETSLEGYFNISYDMAWIFFADKPLIARFTSPYFPTESPAPGSFLAVGEYDIGQWIRPYNLDYHIPIGTTELTFKVNSPLFFVEFFTDEPIVLKRFICTPQLNAISSECAQSPKRYGRFKTLKERYLMGKQALLKEQALFEIKKNLIQ